MLQMQNLVLTYLTKTCNITGESDFHERSARMCLGAVKFGGGCWQNRTSYSRVQQTFWYVGQNVKCYLQSGHIVQARKTLYTI